VRTPRVARISGWAPVPRGSIAASTLGPDHVGDVRPEQDAGAEQHHDAGDPRLAAHGPGDDAEHLASANARAAYEEAHRRFPTS
jgi:hypothetical protein